MDLPSPSFRQNEYDGLKPQERYQNAREQLVGYGRETRWAKTLRIAAWIGNRSTAEERRFTVRRGFRNERTKPKEQEPCRQRNQIGSRWMLLKSGINPAQFGLFGQSEEE